MQTLGYHAKYRPEYVIKYFISFQIVRTDLQELHDFDLKGAPYGYTPFCNDRKEMDGFRLDYKNLS